jgi:hypothetical protein
MAHELHRAGNRIDSTRSSIQEPRQGHQREFPLVSRSYSLQDSRGSYKQHVEDLPSTRRSGERIVHRWTISEAVIADRIPTQNPRQHGLVYDISSRLNVYGLETVEQRIQSYSKETQPSVQFIPETKKATIWGGVLSLFRKVLSQYGESQVDSVQEEKTDDIIASYPRGMRLFLILLSGTLPYVVVSIPPDLGLSLRLRS